MSDPSVPIIPAHLGHYEIIRRLGAGGMAEVFLAKKRGAEGTYKLLVLKRVLPHHGQSRRFRAMFVAEAHLATRLNHPNIVQVYDFQDIGDEGQLLSMEYVEGPDLGRIMTAARQRSARIPPWVAAYIIAEAAKGLHYAHERKDEAGQPLSIVHRDVSPQNILVSFDGAVKIADFGIASANLFRDETGVLKGKFGYMSPEQARGDSADRRSDIYSLGVCLHEMLTGRYLHGGLGGDDLLEAVRSGEVEPPSTYVRDAPNDLEAIVMKALAKHTADRFQTARDMSGAITRAMLSRQELVDAAALEQVIGQLVGREHTSPGVDSPAPSYGSEGKIEAAAPASEIAERPITRTSIPLVKPTGIEGREDTGAVAFRGREKPRGNQEVRHVAVVVLTLFGFEELEATVGKQRAVYATERIRKTLDDIAFKRGAEWSWAKGKKPRAVVGLLANASRAPAEAAWLAVDVHEALAGASEDLDAKLWASVGIVRGIASGERDQDGHLVRHSLHEPADFLVDLLGDRAPQGATWVAGGLYRMVRRDFRWGDAPTIEIEPQEGKPLPRVMRVYALERPLTREERLAEIALAPSDLVGRDAEKADLHAAFHRAVSPETNTQGALISRVVAGEMGIGKTALVATFLAELPPDTRVIRVEASPVRSELPFGAIGDLVRDGLGVEADTPIDHVRSAIANVLGPMSQGEQGEATMTRLAELATGTAIAREDEEDPTFRRKVIGAGVRRMLAAQATRTPLVIVCDGLQWVDKPSLELIAELVHREDPLPILALLVTRPEERVGPYIEGLVRLDLRGLSHEDQLRLVETRLGVREGVAAVCADLIPRVAGNPFFLLEMVDALLERGALELTQTENGESVLTRAEIPGGGIEALPSTLEQIIGDRLRELPPTEHAVVDWLAVASGPLSIADLAELTKGDEAEAVMRLCARGVCDQRGELVDFRHTIARDVAYLAISSATRKRMHRQLGEYLAKTPLARGLSAAIVARHLARGEAHEAAADLYLIAGYVARTSYQTQLATRYYQRALTLLPKSDVRKLVAHEALEAIYRVLGRRRERKAHLIGLRALSKELRHPRWVATALARSARFDLDEGHLTHGIPTAQKAAEIARAAKAWALEVEAENVAAELLRELGDTQGALSACERALAVAAEHQEVPARSRAEVLRAKGVLLRRLGRVSEAVEAYAEAIAVFRKCGARRQEARAKNALAMAMLVTERWEDAIALALSSIGIDLAIGGRFQIAKTLTNVGQAYSRIGDLPRAQAYLKRAREAHERYSDQDAHADTLLVSAEVMISAGDFDAAHSFCGDASALNGVTGSAYDIIHEKIVRSLLSRASGDHSVAAAHAFEARKQAEAHALAAFLVYSTAIEAAARVDNGELHTGILLASTALSSVEHIPTEYGIEIRAVAVGALERAGSPRSSEIRARAAAHVRTAGENIRDPRLRKLFFDRPLVRSLLGETHSPQISDRERGSS